MFRRIRLYFWPRRTLRQRLPLPPIRYTSNNSPWGDPPHELKNTISLLKGYGVARTDHDAYRLLQRYPGMTARQIARLMRRPRRFWPRLKRAWERFRLIW